MHAAGCMLARLNRAAGKLYGLSASGCCKDHLLLQQQQQTTSDAERCGATVHPLSSKCRGLHSISCPQRSATLADNCPVRQLCRCIAAAPAAFAGLAGKHVYRPSFALQSAIRDELQTTAKLMRVAAASGAAKHQVPGAAATEVPGAEPSIPHWLWEQAQVQQIPTRLLELQEAEMPLPSSGLPAAEAAPPSRSSSCCVEEPGREPAAEQPADAPSTDAERAVQVAQPRAAPPSRRLSVAAPVAAPAATALRAAASMTSWHAASPLEALTAQQTSARGRPQSGSIASGAAHQQPHSAPSRNTSSAQELVVRPPAIFKSQSAALRQVADLFEEDMHFALSQAPRAAPLRAGKKAALSAAKPQLLGARKPALASPRSSSGSSEHIPAIRGSRPHFTDSFTQTLPSVSFSSTPKLSQLQAERKMLLQRLNQLDAAIRELPQ